MKVITIGRSDENNIVIKDAKVSRTHLQLVQNDNGICSVVDLNSVNGTFVNGKKITGEVYLQASDIIRIGDTTLNWHKYIDYNLLDPSGVRIHTIQKQTNNVQPTSKSNKTWWIVTVCAVFALVIGGIGLYFYFNEKAQEEIETKIQQEELQKEQERLEAEQKAEEAKRLQDEADELFKQALISQSDKSKALAETKQKEAAEAKRQAEAATAAQHRAESDRIAAENAKEEADRAKVAAEQNSKKAIQNAEEKANKAIAQANTERDSANKKAILTEKFYEEYASMKSDFAKRVCKHLNYIQPKDKTDAKIAIKDLFNTSDNNGKQEIIDAIQAVKQQNGKTNPVEPKIKSDSLKSSNNEEITDCNSYTEKDE